MRRKTTALLVTACALVGTPALAQAVQLIDDEDREQFDDLYQEKLALAQGSRATEDDLALAQEMVELASQIPDSPGVQRLIYIEAIPLASIGGDIELAVRAADRLESLWPGHEAADPGTLLEAASRAYRDASRDQRPAIAEPYLDLLLAAADRAADADDLDRAVTLCRQANTVARAVDSDQREHIEQRLARLSEASAVANRVAMLAASLDKNPQNKPAAKEVVELLIVHRHDPATANRYAPLTGDADLAEVVAMCAQGAEGASAPAALRVGDWYLALADAQDDARAEPLLRRAQRWYDRFLDVYPRDDALAQRVRSMRLVVENRAKRVAEARRAAMRGRWIDLIDTAFDPRLHAIGETDLTLRRSEIHFDQGAFVLPVAPKGDYELRVALTMNKPSPGLVVNLPIANTAATVYYSVLDNTMNSIDGLDEVDFTKAHLNRPGRRVELVFQAKVGQDNQLAIAMLVNGRQSLLWEGPAADVRPNEERLPPAHHGQVLMLSCAGDATFHRIELRERAE
ncbi:MAG: hypothetical protein ACE37H_09045 [Phycisphaeraceae bacterium]